jgi:hypothetical protein
MYDAINRAWTNAAGCYLSWLNSDEQYLPGALAHVKAIFESSPSIDVLFGDYIVVDVGGRPIAYRAEIPFRRLYVANGFLNAASCTLFFRRHLYDSGLLKLDSTLRYAADKELMLRLHSSGVKIAHTRRVLSLFGVDGANLSGHPDMAIEAEAVRQRYGALPRTLRPILRLGRLIERGARGHYLRRAVEYKYAIDEQPIYRDVFAHSVGTRYAISSSQPSTRCD